VTRKGKGETETNQFTEAKRSAVDLHSINIAQHHLVPLGDGKKAVEIREGDVRDRRRS
jgi:hypothetical protein